MTTPAAAAATRVPASPFKGLAPFEDSSSDAILFFGREREREIIMANLLAARLTLLYGASGVGKTSLLRAGVAYELRELAQQSLKAGRGRELAVVVFSSWSGDTLADLRTAVAEELFEGSANGQVGGRSLADDLQAWTEELRLDLYLILDQVEELAVYHAPTPEEEPFAQQLPEIVMRPGLRVNTLLSLREDALATLDFLKAGLPNLFANRLRLEHLDREAGRAAILGPIEAFNAVASPELRAQIEPELVEAVLEQVAAGAVGYGRADDARVEPPSRALIEAPYLQLVMQRLWDFSQGEGSRTLTLDGLRRLGGAQQIVEDHLDRALATLTPSEQNTAAGIFRYLVTPSGTKIAHTVSDLQTYTQAPPDRLEQVLARLTAERILRPVTEGRDEIRRRYEIFHDVLAEALTAWRSAHETRSEVERARLDAEQRRHRAVVVAGAALFAVVVMVAITTFALRERSHASAAALHARARELAATALAELGVNPQRSLRLAVDAARLEESPVAEDALRRALLSWHEKLVLRPAGHVTTVSLDPSGRSVLIASDKGGARTYDAGSGRLLHVFDERGVTTASFGAHGRLVATGTSDGWVRLWSARSGKPLRAWRTGGALAEVDFSADGAFLVAASRDHTARIWRVDRGFPVRVVRQNEPVLSASLSPDDARLLTMTDSAAWLFDRRDGHLLHRLSHGKASQTSASFSPDGRTVATTSESRKALLWNARTGRIEHELVGHVVGRVTTASFSPNGKWLVTASTDEAGRVWDTASGDKVAVLPGHTNFVTDASFSPDGKWVVTASRDRTARVFDASSGLVVSELVGHRGAVLAAAWTRNVVVTGGEDGTARLWDPGTAPQLQLLGSHPGRAPVRAISLSHSGRLVVSAGGDGTARVWRIRDHHAFDPIRHRAAVTSASFNYDDSLLLTTSRDGTARISPWPTSKRPAIILNHPGPVLAGSFDPTGKLVVTAGADGMARIWRANDGEQLYALHHTGAVRAASFSADGKLVLTASDDGTARIWKVDGGRPSHVLRGHSAAVVVAAFSRDDRLVVTASTDHTARLWDARTGRVLHALRGHRAALTAAAFSPDGSLVVTSSRDHDARIWSTATGETLHVLGGHNAQVNDARFSPDGRWIVTAGPANAALWQTGTGRLVLYLRGHRAPLTSASFGRHGSQVLTSSADGEIRVYACSVCARIDGLVAAATRRLQAIARPR